MHTRSQCDLQPFISNTEAPDIVASIVSCANFKFVTSSPIGQSLDPPTTQTKRWLKDNIFIGITSYSIVFKIYNLLRTDDRSLL